MRRREFITLLGGAAAWPLAARAQQQDGRVRRIGWLTTGSQIPSIAQNRLNAFKRRLAELGWIEGRNVSFEERWANSDALRLRAQAVELAALRPDLIFLAGSAPLAAMRRATGSIPIIFASVIDPVGQGFVSSLAEPGGNISGFAESEFGIATKNLELLKKIAPGLKRVAYVHDPLQVATAGVFAEAEAVVDSLGMGILKIVVRSPADVERSINLLAQQPDSGMFVQTGGIVGSQAELIGSLAAHHRLPAVYSLRFFVAKGGLASYAVDDLDLCRRAASYVDRILKGEKPADLPVQLPVKYETVLNLKTARAMGLTLSPEVLALADELIE